MVYLCDVQLCQNLDVLTGEPARHSSEEEIADFIRETIWPEFFKTAVGQNFRTNFELTQEFTDAFQREFARRFGITGEIRGGVQHPGAFLVWRIEEVIGDLVRIKHPSLTSVHKPNASTVERPRDDKGQFISQVAKEVSDDLADQTSTLEIKQKRASSPEYRAAFDKATQLPEVQKQASEASREIADFADWFNNAPASATTPSAFRGGRIRINGGRFVTRAEYDDLLAKAEGLIRGGSIAVDRGIEVKRGGV